MALAPPPKGWLTVLLGVQPFALLPLRALEPGVVSVATGAQLQREVNGGTLHTLVTAHVDTRGVEDSACGVNWSLCVAGLQEMSIQGDCEIMFSAADDPVVALPTLHPRQCVVRVDRNWLSVEGPRMWVHNLHVVLGPRNWWVKDYAALVETHQPSVVWATQVGLQGDNGTGNLADLESTRADGSSIPSTVLLMDSFLGDFKHHSGGAAVWSSQSQVALHNVTVRNCLSPHTRHKGAIESEGNRGHLLCVGCSIDTASRPGLSVQDGAAIYAPAATRVWDQDAAAFGQAVLPVSFPSEYLRDRTNLDRELEAVRQAHSNSPLLIPHPPPQHQERTSAQRTGVRLAIEATLLALAVASLLALAFAVIWRKRSTTRVRLRQKYIRSGSEANTGGLGSAIGHGSTVFTNAVADDSSGLEIEAVSAQTLHASAGLPLLHLPDRSPLREASASPLVAWPTPSPSSHLSSKSAKLPSSQSYEAASSSSRKGDGFESETQAPPTMVLTTAGYTQSTSPADSTYTPATVVPGPSHHLAPGSRISSIKTFSAMRPTPDVLCAAEQAESPRSTIVAMLQRMHADDTALYGRFALTGVGSSQCRHGGQAVVQFVIDRRTAEPLAAKFFMRARDFERERELYEVDALRAVMPNLIFAAEEGWRPLHADGEHSRDGDSEGGEGECGWEDGTVLPACLVMDRGESMEEFVAAAGHDIFTTLQALGHVAKCLGALHEHGWVHRDLKPSNLLWSPSKRSWSLLDFGCAVRAGQSAGLAYSLAYAAPEVLEAVENKQTHSTVTPAMDMWSLGIIAMEMLSEAAVFSPTSLKKDIFDAVLGRTHLPWEDPQLGPSLLKKLGVFRKAVLACLHRDPDQRIGCKELYLQWTRVFQASQTTLAAESGD